jgi:branched-chain amino acid transport system substrate-binding protein
LTGQYQTQGRQTLTGLQAWAAEVNRAGGLTVSGLNCLVEFFYYDDAGLAERAAAATRKLILEDRVDLLFGPYSSGLTHAAAEVAAQEGKVLWNQGGASDSVDQPGHRVVGILSGAREYLLALPGLLIQADATARDLGVVRCSAGTFPRQVSEGMEARALDLGFTKSIHLEFPPEQSDFRDLAQRVVEAQPDLLLVVGRIRHDIALAKALVSCWGKQARPKALAVVATPLDRFRAELGNDAEGFIGPSQWEAPDQETLFTKSDDYFGPAPSQALSVLTRTAGYAGLPVDYPMAQAYAAGLVAQRCVEEAGSLEPDALWETAARLDFHTFFGKFRIDPNTGRQVGRSVFLVQWQQGKKKVIWPPDQAQGKLMVP